MTDMVLFEFFPETPPRDKPGCVIIQYGNLIPGEAERHIKQFVSTGNFICRWKKQEEDDGITFSTNP